VVNLLKIGKVEKRIYDLREENPLVIPQIDPDKQPVGDAIKLLKKLDSFGVKHIAVGSSLSDPLSTQNLVDIIIKDFDFTFTTYVSNTSSFLLKGKPGRSAIYWATIFNANNLFYLRDSLIMGAPLIKTELLEPIPTAYVFDERNSRGTANWLAQANHIPQNKPEISLATSLACEYLGIRFYIMAGGSGSLLPPPESHVRLIRKKTDLFVIPTSGIKSHSHVSSLFEAGADAVHVGSMIESKEGLLEFEKIFNSAKKYAGRSINF
jgi:phosphoglycerol geranylgeranyltransferase